jgi:hypothetical protein
MHLHRWGQSEFLSRAKPQRRIVTPAHDAEFGISCRPHDRDRLPIRASQKHLAQERAALSLVHLKDRNRFDASRRRHVNFFLTPGT